MWILIVLGALVVLLAAGLLTLRILMKKVMAERPSVPRRFPLEDGKRALLLYQPTRHGTADGFADLIARGLNARGYDVTVDTVGAVRGENPEDFELLIFGTGAYFGLAGFPVLRYLREHPFSRKQVVLFSVGSNLGADPEIDQMRAELAPVNLVYRIKVSRGQEEVLRDFVARLELENPDFESIAEEESEEEEEDSAEEE